jgi:hypothetical protein
MADEEIPENVDLRFLATQNARILQELGDARAERAELRQGSAEARDRLDRLEAISKTQAEMLGKVMDATVQIAKGLEVAGLRLNTIDQRLALIEEYTGLVKALVDRGRG